MASRGHLLLALLVLAATAAAASGGRHQARVRRPARPRLELVPAAPDASLADRARDDVHRHAYIRSQLASRRGRRAAEVGASAFAMPLSSGAYTGTGQYFVRFRVGTPAQPFVLVADTGSDLTWVKCAGSSPPGRVFRPKTSKSWAPIPCSSDTCKLDVPFSLANCSSSASPCSYDYRSLSPPLRASSAIVHASITSSSWQCYQQLCACMAGTRKDRRGRVASWAPSRRPSRWPAARWSS